MAARSSIPKRSFTARLYARVLHPGAHALTVRPGPPAAIEELGRHLYLLLVSFRHDGRAVPTPVWAAHAGDRLFVRTDASTGKVKRVRREPHVLVAPSTWRGRPLEAAVRAKARILDAEEEGLAEQALAERYGLVRRVYGRLFPLQDAAYIELRL